VEDFRDDSDVKEAYKQEDASYASASKGVELTMARPALMSLTDWFRE
jgi:hypothetical protein